MRHEHLPALNRYTSPTQYAALQEIDTNKSFVTLLMQGSMSKTVGALLRSAWIKPETRTEDGVVRECWIVTDAGKHAMKLYEHKQAEAKRLQEVHEANVKRLKEENERRKKERQERVNRLHAASLKYYFAEADLRNLENHVKMCAMGLYHEESKEIIENARQEVEREMLRNRLAAQRGEAQ
jgi:hypothetical protein